MRIDKDQELKKKVKGDKRKSRKRKRKWRKAKEREKWWKRRGGGCLPSLRARFGVGFALKAISAYQI